MTTSSLIFVDARVSDYAQLMAHLPTTAEVVVLDSTTDGLQQMADYLAGRTGIEAIHVVSHGSQGALYLGNVRVDGDYLIGHSAQLASIGSSLTETGDILLYGCNVAQGDVGLQFVQSLANLTGADVAASVDVTGPAALGGNSVLETKSGEIQTLVLDASSLDEVLISNTAPTFMTRGDGKVTTDLGSSADYGYSVAMQPDGKILIAGTSTTSGNSAFALVRYNSDGSLDTSFSGDGKVTTDLGSDYDYGYSMAVQTNGKILIAGSKRTNSYDDVALVRYNNDGSLDTSFSGDGKVTTNLGSISYYGSSYSTTVQADGKILVAVRSVINDKSDFALVRYNSDGSLDTSFSGDGKVTTDFGSSYYGTSSDLSYSVAVQTNGKILVAGYSVSNYEADFALVRYNSDGSLDTSFSGDGKVTTNLGSNSDFGYSVAVQADSKILVAGRSHINGKYDFALVRYNSDGSLDTSFSGDGKVTTDLGSIDYGNSVIVQANGQILVAGTSTTSGTDDFALVRYNSDGSLDTSFSEDGKVTTDFGSSSDIGFNAGMQADGKILVAGYSGSDFALVRYNSDGSLDTSFNRSVSSLGGSVTYTENAPAVVLDSNVQIYDAELTAVGYSNAVLTLARHGGAQAEDQFSGVGIVAGQSSGNVSVSGTTVGIYTWNSGTLRIVFNSNATQEFVNQAAQAISYQNTSDNPTNSIQIDWKFSDGNTGSQGTGGALETTDSTTVNITAVNDAPTGAVTLTGTATQGQTLTAANTLADVDSLGTVSYQWKANGSAITGATGSTYTLGQGDVGKTISVTASYTDGQGTAEAVTSAATTAVANVNDAPTGTVTLTGTATQGQTLTAANTLVDVDGLGTVSYQWKANGSAITGATGTTYILGQADVGKTISVTASYTDSQGANESVTSTDTVFVTNNVGTAENVARINDGHSYEFLIVTAVDGSKGWFSGGLNLNGDWVYTLETESLLEKTISNVYTLERTEQVLASTSNEKERLQSIQGEFSEGAVLADFSDVESASEMVGVLNIIEFLDLKEINLPNIPNYLPSFPSANEGLFVTYNQLLSTNGTTSGRQFFISAHDGVTPTNWEDFDEIGGNQINLGAWYFDRQVLAKIDLTVLTYFINNTFPVGDVSITGATVQGNILTVANTLDDLDGLGIVSYQWNANGSAIIGGVGDSYILTRADVGKTISVTASYIDGQGTAEAVTSSATVAITGAVNTITGNSSNNVLLSTSSDDAIDGGSGTDTVSYANATAAVTVTLTSNTEQNTGGAGIDTLLNIENLTGSKYNDKLTGNAAANVLNGGAGADTMTGGNGNDTYYVNHASDLVNEALAGGTDTVYSTLLAYTLRANVEKGVVQGTVAGNLTGNALANTLTGNAAANRLTGGAGNDTLQGNGGNDILIGGAGKDVLTGGAGNDVFDFNTVAESGLTATTRDVITDFVRGQDKIDLSTIDANTALTGNQAFTGLIGANVAFTKAGQLRLNAGVLYGNTDADATAEFSIALTGITTLANTDFVL